MDLPGKSSLLGQAVSGNRDGKAASQLAFLRNLQRLLDEGQFTASYKYALLIALSDLSIEKSSAPDGTLRIDISELAERFIELYWRHTAPFRGSGVLAQNTARQATVISAIANVRSRVSSLAEVRRSKDWSGLVRRLCRLLLEMPLWKLQTVRQGKLVFLYEETLVGEAVVLKPGVAESFRDLHSLIQALIQLAWLRYVQRLPQNQPLVGQGSDLADFLFGSERSMLGRLRQHLLDLQHGSCFYCCRSVKDKGEVDHFIPWVLYSRDLGHNFVLAHGSCNRYKSDLLADVPHLARWNERNTSRGSELRELFKTVHLLHDIDTSTKVAYWAYERVDQNRGSVWTEGKSARPLDQSWRGILG